MDYCVKKTEIVNPPIDSPEWAWAETARLKDCGWAGERAPSAYAKLLDGPEGISVLMHTDEAPLRRVNTEENSEVCEDSCMEFFFKPDPHDINFLNFEMNPNGVLLLSIGKDRHGRIDLEEDHALFDIESDAKDGDWTIKLYIPKKILLKYFKKLAPVCRANFYKCGDKTENPHFLAWSPVDVVEPDFHVPDFFGFIRFNTDYK